jgi:bifunctional non-homologous end joining protein LigD
VISRPMIATAPRRCQSAGRYEVKWDGYRALAVKDGARVRLISRNEKDLDLRRPPAKSAVDLC